MSIARVPFAFVRSALFHLPEHWQAPTHPPTPLVPIPAAKDYEMNVAYAGPRLTSRHAAAWQAMVALAYQGEGLPVATELRLVNVLRAMGLTSVQTHAKRRLLWLLYDLECARVSVRTRCHYYTGSLLMGDDLGRGRIRMELPVGLLPLLENEVVLLPVESRAAFNDYPLAAWLHDWIASHKAVYKIPLETLRVLCGSALSPHHFLPRLVAALERLKAADNFFEYYDIKRGTLTIHKKKTRVVLLKPKPASRPRFHL